MKKKILTIEQLVKFCESQNFSSFSAKDSGYQLSVQIPTTFEVEDDSTTGLLRVKFKVAHSGLNRNGSYISKENLEKAAKSIKNRPVLANIHQLDDGTWDFQSHDVEVITNADGEEETVYIEKQVGSFTEEEPTFVYDEERDIYFMEAYAVIPEGYTMAADILRRKEGSKSSCELCICEMSYNAKEHYLDLQDFYFMGDTLLGKMNNGREIGEGMLGARADIVDFSAANNSVVENKHYEIDEKLVELLEKLNATLSNFNNTKENLEEGGQGSMNKFDELLDKYGKKAEDVTFETDGLSDEELEEAFAKAFGEENPSDEGESVIENQEEEKPEVIEEEACGQKKKKNCDEDEHEDRNDVTENEACGKKKKNCEEDEHEETPEAKENEACGDGKKKKKCSIENEDGEVSTFEISLDEKIDALWNLVNITYSESDNTYYGVTVYESHVIMHDYWNGRHFKQTYSEADNEFNLTGDRVEVYAEYVTEEERKSLDEMRSNYSSIMSQLQAYKDADSYNDKMTVFEDESYANYLETKEFKSLMDKDVVMKYSKEELMEKADAALGKVVKATKNFALKETEEKKQNKVSIPVVFEEEAKGPYGDYFKSLNK